MLVFRLSTNHYRFYLGILLMGNSDDVLEEFLVEAFGGRDVINIFHNSQLTDDSVQGNIICLEWFTVGLAKDKPPTIILLQELGVEL